MEIGIAGCGIAGTAAALLLARAGHRITMFEQAPECRSIGAGILVSPQGQQVLGRLELLDSIAAASARLSGMRAMQTSGRTLVDLRYDRLQPGLYGLGVHRGRLFSQLLAACRNAGVEVQNGFRVLGLSSAPEGVRIRSADGMESPCFDFVIAADGSRSSIRAATGARIRGGDYNHVALWTTAPCGHQPAELQQVVRGTRRLAGLLPIGGGEASFFWGLRAGEFEELRAKGFGHWRNQVLELFPACEPVFETIRDFDQLTCTGYRHVSMSRWHGDRLICIGDAGHPSSPHLGQGVNLALADAACLADSLAECHTFEQAAWQYAARRRRQLRYYQLLTRMVSPFFQSDGWLLGAGRDVFLPWMPHLPLVGRQMLRTLCGFKQGWFG